MSKRVKFATSPLKKRVAMLCAAVLLCTTGTVGVSAETVNQPGQQSVEVLYESAMGYNVTIPKTIVLQDTEQGQSADYTVKVTGAIDESTVINVVPDATFNMSNGAKAIEQATVEQTKTEFPASEVNTSEGSTANGTVRANLQPDSWQGSFNFTISEGSSVPVEPHKHQYTSSITKQPSCTSLGVKTFTCDCGDSYTEDIPMTSHNYGDDNICDDCGVEDPDSTLAAGLYDSDGNLLVNWEDSGINVERAYSSSESTTLACSPYVAITTKYPETTKVVIPESIRSIGEKAFNKCDMITDVLLGNKVNTIGQSAFYKCSSLVNINLPDSLVKIDQYAFYNCSFKEIKIPANVTYIGYNSFGVNSAVEKIIVDSQNKVYDSRNDCNAIIQTKDNMLMMGCQNTIIPDGISEIKDDAFRECYGLESIVIPESVTRIGSSAFNKCTALNSLNVPNSVTAIGIAAFANVPHVIYNGSASGAPWGAVKLN